MNGDQKEAHEREVFLEFAGAAGLAVDHGTVENCKPPQPDIRCKLEGQAVYFEFGRLLDQGMQRLRLRALSGGIVSTGDEDVRLPEREMLRTKLQKAYVTSETPIDLVLYYDNENALVGDVPVFGDSGFKWHADHVMRPLIEELPSVFRRVWVYERHRRTVLWCYPEERAV
jgi:hypothetical protein